MAIKVIGKDSVRFGSDEVTVDFYAQLITVNGRTFSIEFLESIGDCDTRFRSLKNETCIYTLIPKETKEKAHPEDLCELCGGYNLKNWHAPSPIWNQVMRNAAGDEKFSVICPQCFSELAHDEGIDPASWCLTLHADERGVIKALSATAIPRHFDWNKCLWTAVDGAVSPL